MNLNVSTCRNISEGSFADPIVVLYSPTHTTHTSKCIIGVESCVFRNNNCDVRAEQPTCIYCLFTVGPGTLFTDAQKFVFIILFFYYFFLQLTFDDLTLWFYDSGVFNDS